MAVFDFHQSYFLLFELPAQYDIDLCGLTEKYRTLQREFHPDRFAADSEDKKRLAVQMSAFINEAYKTLQSPVKRAQYLLSQAGVNADMGENTFHDPEFLMQQIDLREELAELNEVLAFDQAEKRLETFNEHVQSALNEQQQLFKQAYQTKTFDIAQAVIAKMQFLQKLAQEAQQLEEHLLDY